jgi:hypothetical protein
MRRRPVKQPRQVIGRGTFQGLTAARGELAISYRIPVHVLIKPETRDRFAAYWEGGQAFTDIGGTKIRGPLESAWPVGMDLGRNPDPRAQAQRENRHHETMKDWSPYLSQRLDSYYFWASQKAKRCLVCGVEWQESISWSGGFFNHCQQHAKRDSKDANTPRS